MLENDVFEIEEESSNEVTHCHMSNWAPLCQPAPIVSLHTVEIRP